MATTITVTIPLKALVLYASYMSKVPSWDNRKAPDYLITVIGTHTNPDDLVTVTVESVQLLNFVTKLISDSYGVIGTVARSILNNTPAISGYTSLFNQITATANGTSSEKEAATQLISQYNYYTQTQASLYNQMYQAGLDFINN